MINCSELLLRFYCNNCYGLPKKILMQLIQSLSSRKNTFTEILNICIVLSEDLVTIDDIININNVIKSDKLAVNVIGSLLQLLNFKDGFLDFFNYI